MKEYAEKADEVLMYKKEAIERLSKNYNLKERGML